jgi:hypothetical protein
MTGNKNYLQDYLHSCLFHDNLFVKNAEISVVKILIVGIPGFLSQSLYGNSPPKSFSIRLRCFPDWEAWHCKLL